MTSDLELLGQFAREKSQDAFAATAGDGAAIYFRQPLKEALNKAGIPNFAFY